MNAQTKLTMNNEITVNKAEKMNTQIQTFNLPCGKLQIDLCQNGVYHVVYSLDGKFTLKQHALYWATLFGPNDEFCQGFVNFAFIDPSLYEKFKTKKEVFIQGSIFDWRGDCVQHAENTNNQLPNDVVKVIDRALFALRVAGQRHDEDRGTTGIWDAEIDQLEDVLLKYSKQHKS